MAQSDANLISGKVRELTRLIREARQGQPDHAGGLRHDEALRPHTEETTVQKVRSHVQLEALAKELAKVYAGHMQQAQQADHTFTLAVIAGNPPRYWVDLTSFVLMADNGRLYRFIKDTPDGHVPCFEAENVHDMARAVAGYMANYLAPKAQKQTIEQASPAKQAVGLDKAQPARPAAKNTTLEDVAPENVSAAPEIPPARPIVVQPLSARTDWVKTVLAFALGLLCGAAGLLVFAWLQTPPAL